MNNAELRKNGKQQKNRKGQRKQDAQIKDLEKPIELNEKSLDSARGGQDQWKQAAKIISEMP
ncbi:MAG: hypothetical protein AB7W16_12550 [Candidatus Obscuribacterales bacterium]